MTKSFLVQVVYDAEATKVLQTDEQFAERLKLYASLEWRTGTTGKVPMVKVSEFAPEPEVYRADDGKVVRIDTIR